MDSKAVGNFIAELRKEQGLTQKQLAEKLSVTDKAVSRWETGKGYPDIEILTSLSEALGVSLNELIAGKHLDEEEIKTQSDKNIEEAYKRAKKAKRKKRFIIIISVLAAVALIVCAVFEIDEAVYRSRHHYDTEMMSRSPRAGILELDALIGKNYNLSAEANYTYISLAVENGEVKNFATFFGDPRYGENFQSHISFNDKTGGADLVFLIYGNHTETLSQRVKRFFKRETARTEYIESDGIPYRVFTEIVETVDFEDLIEKYVDGEFEGYHVSYYDDDNITSEEIKNLDENALYKRRPKLLYKDGAVTEFDFNDSEETKYYILSVGGTFDNMTDGNNSVYIFIEA